ncbi:MULTISPECIES: hypothetical protein [Brevibacillus]|jgi:hypothetical protein|uniref:Lipoprotein n=1 Tax=Brevibacillus parabrevis TaxID=54914 RepID=A0A4Y3PLY6_BREPA|nr:MULTISPECIES: hypothetical protein [Brevibacillus]MBU8715616.1 hypothetical protein [Brevibacillus parabrevis]MDH6352250.1 hypothetical protein [Brevibacillus sp. 1238]MED2254552.1 hypothetical protein [Brevibacillus parabrevis]NRQ56169.1 hypothetical protein [Brevibacillus sp. HD1.4A]RNB94653.1 hypothetical protein EDM60_15410 [Brevibacillus parabrevis]
MKKVEKIAPLYMAAVLLLTGCQLGMLNQSSFQELAQPPAPVIAWKGKTAVTVPTSYCWNYENEGVCMDMAAPPEVIGEQKPKPLQVNPGAMLTVTYSPPPTTESLTVAQWIGSKRIEQLLENGNQWKAPEQPGWYLFDVRGQWSQGDAGHAFVIEVRENRPL